MSLAPTVTILLTGLKRRKPHSICIYTRKVQIQQEKIQAAEQRNGSKLTYFAGGPHTDDPATVDHGEEIASLAEQPPGSVGLQGRRKVQPVPVRGAVEPCGVLAAVAMAMRPADQGLALLGHHALQVGRQGDHGVHQEEQDGMQCQQAPHKHTGSVWVRMSAGGVGQSQSMGCRVGKDVDGIRACTGSDSTSEGLIPRAYIWDRGPGFHDTSKAPERSLPAPGREQGKCIKRAAGAKTKPLCFKSRPECTPARLLPSREL